MYDCSKDVLAYHDEDVSLPQSERAAMKERRDANRTRVKKGLKDKGKPTPLGCRSQGSYAMKTMVQEPDKDYDIDDGVYFKKEDLVGAKGGEMSPLDVRQMVRDAVDDGSFKTAPEVMKNCVRVYYGAGYHVDIPCYREIRTRDAAGNETVSRELASSSWKTSDPIAVTEWFDKENQDQSPDDSNGRQLRRNVRLLKRFARSRSSWKGRIATGFMITKLVTESYRKDTKREDGSLRYTMIAIRDRLQGSLIIKHPVLNGEYLTKGSEDSRARFLLEKLDEAVPKLDVLDESSCKEKDALDAWDSVFNTDFFSKRAKKEEETKSDAGRAVNIAIISENRQKAPLRETEKDGGGRYA